MDKTSVSPKKAKKIALVSGLILGVINTLILLGTFYLTPKLLESAWSAFCQICVVIVLIVLFCLEIRKRIGGYWSFREALSLNFIMLYSLCLTTTFFTTLIGRLIDPAYYPKMKEIALKRYDSFYRKSGADNAPDFLEMRIKFIEQLDHQFYPSIINILKSLCFMAIGYFIGALILAVIFKKEKTRHVG